MNTLNSTEALLLQIKEGMCSKGCSYCYEKGKKQVEMELDTILQWFEYMNQAGIESFEVIGSEPTEHSQFNQIMEDAERRNLKSVVYTAGLHLEKLHSPNITKLILHQTAVESDQYMAEINQLLAEGKNIDLRVNFDSPELAEEHIIMAFLERVKPEYHPQICLKYSFTAKVAGQETSSHFTPENFEKIKDSFLAFCLWFHSHYPDVGMYSERPVFLCNFSQKELTNYSFAGLDGKCNMEYTVYPDGKIGLCPPVETLVPKLEITSAEQIGPAIEHLRESVFQLYEKPSFPRCQVCDRLKGHECQGGCLSYKADAPVAKPPKSLKTVDFSMGQLEIQYDKIISKCVPNYQEIQRLVAKHTNGNHVLDLGIGTGNLEREIFAIKPEAKITGIDSARKFLLAAQLKNQGKKLIPVEADIRFADFGRPDCVVSGITIHHLTDPEKTNLYRKIFSVLPEGGSFINFDMVTPTPEDEEYLFNNMRKQGLSEQFIDQERKEMLERDQCQTLEDHLGELQKIGFLVELLYRDHQFVVVKATRGQE